MKRAMGPCGALPRSLTLVRLHKHHHRLSSRGLLWDESDELLYNDLMNVYSSLGEFRN